MIAKPITDTTSLGRRVRDVRRALGLTQPDLALSAGVGVRFIVDLERGKPTAQIGKVMTVLAALRIEVELSPPPNLQLPDG
jgi:HTH-type transcriptional regulator/antitoxin HipB